MSRRSFPNIIQRQINQSLPMGEDVNITEQLRFASLNTSRTLEGIIDHERSFAIDVHGIRETILDVVNENLLINAGLELDENVPNSPDNWDFVTEATSVSGSLDSTVTQYGYRAFKIEGTNPTSSSVQCYLSQVVNANFVGNGFYSLSFYLLDHGLVDFEYFAEVVPYSVNNVNLGAIKLSPPASGYVEDTANFIRWYESLQLPEETHHVVVKIGIEIPANTEDLVEVWIDYPCFNPGITLHKPSELVEGILKTKHISTEGLDAKVIKTGDLFITKQMTLSTEGGDVRLYYHDDNEGNVLQFLRPRADDSGLDTVVTLGKYGSKSDEYGIKAGNTTLSDQGIFIGQGEINLGDGKFSVTNDGILTAVAGTIANFHITQDRLVSGALTLDSGAERIIIQKGNTPDVVIGQYELDRYGLKAGGTTLDKDGISITSGSIKLGNDPLTGTPLFSVNNDGYLVAKSGTIADFTIKDYMLQSNNTSLTLDAANSTITLSDPDNLNYATILQTGGVFGKAPIAKLTHFDTTKASPKYYININRVFYEDKECKIHEDYSYNRMTGEVVKLKSAHNSMPDVVNIEYIVVDYTEDEVFGDFESYVEEVSFVSKVRSAAIITDDTLIDATFIKNLIIGSAEIGYASINTAHIQEIHGSKIIAGTIDTSQLDIGKSGNLIPNSTFISKEFYFDWSDLMLGTPNAPYNFLYNNYEWTTEESLFDGASIRLSNSDNGVSYIGLDAEVGVVLKPHTVYVFSAFHKLLVPEGEGLEGFNLEVSGDCTDVSETDSIMSDNDLDIHTHSWKRKALKFKTGASGYVRLLSVLSEPSSEDVVGWVDGLMLEESATESIFYKSGTTRIRGGNVETNSITLNQLDFVPLHAKNVVASINATDEAILIEADKLAITSELYDLKAELKIEIGRVSSKVEQKITHKPSSATLFKFEKNIYSTNGQIAELVN